MICFGNWQRNVEELRSKMADVSVSSSVGTLQSSREFSQKSVATKQEVNHITQVLNQKRHVHFCKL